MTTPTTEPVPTKAKAWVALIGSLLSVGIPMLLQVSTALPPQYQAIIGGLVALLTMVGVYRAPYVPKNTVMTLKAKT